MQNRYTSEEVDYAFGGVNSVSEEFRKILAKTISQLPRKIVEWTTENLMFISSSEAYWAFSLSKREWGHIKGFVFLSENLKDEPGEKQVFSIIHEIAHHMHACMRDVKNPRIGPRFKESSTRLILKVSS